MRATISLTKLPIRTAWAATTQRPVLRTEARTVSMSSGTRLRRSMTSVSTPCSLFSRSAAASASTTAGPQADDRGVGAFADHPGDADRLGVVVLGHDALGGVEALALDEQDGVVRPDRRLQQPLGVGGRRRVDDVQAGDVGEDALQRLRVLAAVALAGADRGADDERDLDLRAGHVVPLAGLVRDLVRGHQGEVHVHQFDDRAQPDHRGADAGPADAGFGDRRVEDALAAEGLEQVLGQLEGAAVVGHVLAVDDDSTVAQHLLDESLTERVLVVT